MKRIEKWIAVGCCTAGLHSGFSLHAVAYCDVPYFIITSGNAMICVDELETAEDAPSARSACYGEDTRRRLLPRICCLKGNDKCPIWLSYFSKCRFSEICCSFQTFFYINILWLYCLYVGSFVIVIRKKRENHLEINSNKQTQTFLAKFHLFYSKFELYW